ncbi:MAG: M28 family peptidase, partial [Pirellulales bacterium]
GSYLSTSHCWTSQQCHPPLFASGFGFSRIDRMAWLSYRNCYRQVPSWLRPGRTLPNLAGSIVGLLVWSFAGVCAAEPSQAPKSTSSSNPVDGRRAYGYLKAICALGPRPSGSRGMRDQRSLVVKHFEKVGGEVDLQRFRAPDPRGGPAVAMANVICQWHPRRAKRIVLCAHYDTRPLPDRDPNPIRRRRGVFLGANDGASGVALLMELAHHMPHLDSRYGVDFVLFDGEEFVYDESDPYFLGSQWFARRYVRDPPSHRYRWGLLFDMVADADLQLFQERHSMEWPDTRPLVLDIWATAQRLGIREFIGRRKYSVRDDHLQLRNIAKIPTCDIIDFDYDYWHTEGDAPNKCSATSLAKVGRVVLEWLRTVR